MRLGDGVGFQVALLVLLVEFGGRGVVVQVKEVHIHFLALTAGHGGHDVFVGVLLPTGGVQGRLRGTGTIDADATDDHLA